MPGRRRSDGPSAVVEGGDVHEPPADHVAAAPPLKVRPIPARMITGGFVAALGLLVLVIALVSTTEAGAPVLILAGIGAVLAPFARRVLRRLGASTLVQAYSLASVYLALVSTLVLRKRSAIDLADNPLDTAGLFRLLALVLALVLASMSLALNSENRFPRPPRFVFFVGAYIAASSIALLVAVDPGLVAFRVLELTVFGVVFLGVYGAFRRQMFVPMRNLMWFVYLLVASSLVSLAVDRNNAWFEPYGFRPRLKGVYPYLSANYLGILGCLCVAYGLGHRRVRWAPVLVGAGVTLAAQHRTGVLAIAVLVLLRLVLARSSTTTFLAAFAIGLGLSVVAFGVLGNAWSRGQDAAEVGTLSARTNWWESGVEALDRSPLTGLGLSSGARFEVFAERGRFEVDVPNLHSTWLEALVGVGVIGVVLLAIAYVLALRDGWRAATRGRFYVPLLVLVALGINSLTHTTFELASLSMLAFLFAGASASGDLETKDFSGASTMGRAEALTGQSLRRPARAS